MSGYATAVAAAAAAVILRLRGRRTDKTGSLVRRRRAHRRTAAAYKSLGSGGDGGGDRVSALIVATDAECRAHKGRDSAFTRDPTHHRDCLHCIRRPTLLQPYRPAYPGVYTGRLSTRTCQILAWGPEHRRRMSGGDCPHNQ